MADEREEDFELALQTIDEDGSRKKKLLLRLKQISLLVKRNLQYIIPIFLIFAISGGLIYCVIHLSIGGNDTHYVRNTSEYQITPINGIQDMLNRSAVTSQLIDIINTNSRYLNLNSSLGNISTRAEYSVTVHGCQTNDFIRVREYTTGYGEGTATIDIKDNRKFRYAACNLPYWPAMDNVTNAYQKCEDDYHYCKSGKSSRETRIELPSFAEFKTCNDIYKYYPWAYDKSRADYPVIPNVSRWWWVYYYPGIVSGTRFEFSFTLKYDNETMAITESDPPKTGEISLRLFETNDGFGEYDPDVKADFENVWAVLHETMSTPCN